MDAATRTAKAGASSTHSFCASMMMSVLSVGDAVNVGSPTMSRNDWTCVADAILLGSNRFESWSGAMWTRDANPWVLCKALTPVMQVIWTLDGPEGCL